MKRAEKHTTSVVVVVDPLHVSQFTKSIQLFSRARTVAPAYSASYFQQCRKYRRFGHSAPLCKEEAQACPICTLLHHLSAHRCANQSCPQGGFEKSVVGCCNASPPSGSTVVVSMPSLMAPVLSAVRSSPLFAHQGIKTYPMPPKRAFLRPPLRVKLPPQPYWLLKPGTVPIFLPLANPPNPRLLSSFAAHLPSLTSPPPSPAGSCLVVTAPSSRLVQVLTGASLRRVTSIWNFRCRQVQPQHRDLHHPNPFITLVV